MVNLQNLAISFSNDQARRYLVEILDRPEFSRLRLINQLEQWWNSLLDWLNTKTPYKLTGEWSDPLPVFLFVVGLILAVYLVKLLTPHLGILTPFVMEKSHAVVTPEVPTPHGLRQRAEELAKREDYREAIRHLYLALLHELNLQGLIRFRSQKTNFDYWQELKATAPIKQREFRALADLFEHKWYGLEGATAADYQQASARYALLVRRDYHEG